MDVSFNVSHQHRHPFRKSGFTMLLSIENVINLTEWNFVTLVPKNWEEPLMLQLIDSSIHCVIRRSRKKHFEVSFSFVTSPTFLKVDEKNEEFLGNLANLWHFYDLYKIIAIQNEIFCCTHIRADHRYTFFMFFLPFELFTFYEKARRSSSGLAFKSFSVV